MEEMLKLTTNYGLGIVLAIAIFISLTKFSMYLMTKVFEQHQEERNIYMKMVDEHFKSQNEAHAKQREEHTEFHTQQVITTESLKQVNEALHRVNGIK